MNVKLNIKSIIFFENLTKKSFNDFDINNIDDMLRLVYSVLVANNDDFNILFDDFINNFEKLNVKMDKIMKKLLFEIKLIEDLTPTPEPIDNESVKTIEQSTEQTYIKDIAAMLIINAGMDANYVMNDLSISNLNLFMNAYSEKTKQDLENKRLWCYLTVLPHIQSDKINTPSKLYPFPWEDEQNELLEKNALKNAADELPAMFDKANEILKLIDKQQIK